MRSVPILRFVSNHQAVTFGGRDGLPSARPGLGVSYPELKAKVQNKGLKQSADFWICSPGPREPRRARSSAAIGRWSGRRWRRTERRWSTPPRRCRGGRRRPEVTVPREDLTQGRFKSFVWDWNSLLEIERVLFRGVSAHLSFSQCDVSTWARSRASQQCTPQQ